MGLGKLKEGHRKAFGNVQPQKGKIEPKYPHLKDGEIDTVSVEERIERAHLFSELPVKVIKRAWFTLSHLLLDDNAIVVDMGFGTGQMAYAMSILKPKWTFIAYDSQKDKIETAKKKYTRDNLEFRHGDICQQLFDDNSVDAIIDSYVLHEIYSGLNYNIRHVRHTLENQFKALKPGGYCFIRDHTVPTADEFILMEMKDEPSQGEDLETMSEADLLIWFSDHIRSSDALNTGGFFLEELPARFPNTRLFRLPHKWAYEFILRKDDRSVLKEELNKEYTFATHRDLRQELRSLGARLSYTASHWNEDRVNQHMVDHFRLYKEDGSPLGYPETSYIVLAQKIPLDESLRFQEWRTTRDKPSSIDINPVRNIKTGEVIDIASRRLEITEIIPYRVTDDNKLKLYLHDSIPRSLVNTVPRNGKNIDGKQWSGHMVEALGMEGASLFGLDKAKPPEIKGFVKDQLNLDTEEGAKLKDGPSSYPDPKTIDERISTKYICVSHQNPIAIPLKETGYTPPEGYPFTTMGKLREYDAQSILNAISVGLIPAGRLEAQILMLFQLLNLRAENWSESPLTLSEVDVKQRMNMKDVLRDMAEDKKTFAPVKHEAGQLRLLQSVFLEEGQDEIGGMKDLSSRPQDFFLHEEKSQNLAVVLPMTKDISGEVLVGVTQDYAPVPERYKGNGTFINLPSLSLPPHIEDMDSAKRYVAEYFKVKPQFVGTLGEPFFQHVGMTPQRVFPFAIATNGGVNHYESASITSYAPLKQIWDICSLVDCYESLLKTIGKTYCTACIGTEMEVARNFSESLSASASMPSMNTSHESSLMGSSLSEPSPSYESQSADVVSEDKQKEHSVDLKVN
ncbi:MAG: methyltransferase [Alphaproteobacteria bacterium]|mgnify:CR=1 FL=1|nr:methyltransferase [Alphaproteobacteria bacterium]